MGLLDDAIREHLELKRRRGADPGEVARLEREALGPVTRDPAPSDPEPLAVAAQTDYAPQEDEPAEPISPQATEIHHGQETAEIDMRSVIDGQLEMDDLADENNEYGFDEPPAQPVAEEDQQSEDVLQETPDFLQDTPDHERLWFEQQPPRDFDFDK